MRQILFCLGAVVLLFHTSLAYATSGVDSLRTTPTQVSSSVEYTLPYPGLLPDHPLYGLKRMRDWLVIVFTRNPEHKSDTYLLFADKKIGMAKALWEIGKREKSLSILREAESDLFLSVQYISRLEKENILPVGMAQKRSLSLEKHEEIIQQMLFQATSSEEASLQDILMTTDKAKRSVSSIIRKMQR